MAVERCAVGFKGQSGITYSVYVAGESVFEAATRALVLFQRQPWLKMELTLATVLLVQRKDGKDAARVYKVPVRRLLAWFDESGRDRARRFQLKRLLERPQDSPRVNKRIRAH